MCKLSVSDRNKLGNTVVYIAQRVSQLSKTKLLKLLYLMEEYSVVRFRTPFLGLPFEVWQAGPVANTEFCDDEFSDNDMLVMDEVIRLHGHKSDKELSTLSDYQTDLSTKLQGKDREFYLEQLNFLRIRREYERSRNPYISIPWPTRNPL